MKLQEALNELRKDKRNFQQGIDLIVNLKGIDIKRDNIATIINIPHKIKNKTVCAFFEKKSEVVKTVTPLDFPKYKDKKELKNLVKDYDFFIAEAKLMPSVATNFGKILGPTGKMPSPQLGVLASQDPATLKALLAKIDNSVKIRVKEASVKVSIGKENMDDSQIISNIEAVYRGLENVLPVKRDNVKSVMIKFTMSKPIKVEVQ